MTEEFKQQIQKYIDILSGILEDNADKSKQRYHELRHWIPNCIECLQFAVDNESSLEEKPSLLNDIIDTIKLLHGWLFEDRGYSYVILEKKFGKAYSPEEVGKTLKILYERLKENYNNIVGSNYKTDILNACECDIDSIYHMVKDGMSTKDALQKISDMFNEANNTKQEPTIEQLKKQIRYSKNPMEVKMFNRKMNELYKKNGMKLRFYTSNKHLYKIY